MDSDDKNNDEPITSRQIVVWVALHFPSDESLLTERDSSKMHLASSPLDNWHRQNAAHPPHLREEPFFKQCFEALSRATIQRADVTKRTGQNALQSTGEQHETHQKGRKPAIFVPPKVVWCTSCTKRSHHVSSQVIAGSTHIVKLRLDMTWTVSINSLFSSAYCDRRKTSAPNRETHPCIWLTSERKIHSDSLNTIKTYSINAHTTLDNGQYDSEAAHWASAANSLGPFFWTPPHNCISTPISTQKWRLNGERFSH